MWKSFLLALCITGFCLGQLPAQTGTKGTTDESIRNKQRTIYIYNFTKYVDWKNTKDLSHFDIGVLDPQGDSLVNEIRSYVEKKRIKDLPVRVRQFNSIGAISKVQILYVHQRTDFRIDQVMEQIAGDQTLLIGEEYPFHRCMINFVDIDGEFNFELNQDKINQAGLFVAPALVSFAIKSNSDWEALFRKSEKFREEEKKLAAEQLNQIKAQKEKIDKQKQEIENQEAKLETQRQAIKEHKTEIEDHKNRITDKEGELGKLVAEINARQSRIDQLGSVLAAQEARIDTQRVEIEQQKKEVDKQNAVLEEQKHKIDLKEQQIAEKNETLNKQLSVLETQRWVIYLAVAFAGLVLLFVVFQYRNIRSKKRANAKLEEQNEAITAKNQEIEKQKQAIEKSTATLIKSARMASLGQVAANMAHEVNTPLGAIKSSAEHTILLMDDFMQKLIQVSEQSSEEAMEAFRELLITHSGEVQYRTTSEDRKIRKTLQAMLGKKGIDNPRRVADLLLMAGITKMSPQLNVILKQENRIELIQALTNFLRRRSHLSTILLAVNKASRVVLALKSYSRANEQNELTDINIADSLDTILVIYQNLLKRGIEVQKNYQATRIIRGYSNKLSQVWTNIVHNAIQAMGDKGKLTIETKDDPGGVLVSISDTGTGIGPEIRDKVFEPFFTTKESAEGTGLGLDISREIITAHGGKIWFESTVGEGTTFFILLPLS